MNNNDFEMPDLKENELDENKENQNELKERIEIPKEYYEKLEKEKVERLAAQEKKEKEEESTKNSGGTFLLIIINALLIFGLLYAMTKYNNYIIFAIPIYIILGTIISSTSKKKDTTFNVSILVGGMISAVICFIVSMSKKEMETAFIYYATASFIVAFIGYLISSIITKIITDKENVKAMHKIFYFIVIVAIIGLPYYYYKNNTEDFMRIVFNNDKVVIANDEISFITSTLRNRYHIDFTCSDKAKNHKDSINHTRITERECWTNNKETTITVFSTMYNDAEKEFIIKDSYLDDLYITPAKDELEKKIKEITQANQVAISLYPKNKCYFIGDCESNDNYEKEIKLDNLYKYSKDLLLYEYLNMSKEEFINNYGFKIIVTIRGVYTGTLENELESFANSSLDILNELGYKNNKGFMLVIKDSATVTDAYKIDVKANNGKFINPNKKEEDF